MTTIETLLLGMLFLLALIMMYVRWIYIKVQYPNDPYNGPWPNDYARKVTWDGSPPQPFPRTPNVGANRDVEL